MPRLIVNLSRSQAFVCELKPGVNYVGRSWANNIQINHPTVSDRHCEIVWADKHIRVRDLHSTNGTFLDHRPIQEAEFELGQMLQVGAVNIILEIPKAVPPPNIAIPTLPTPKTFERTFLPDGATACWVHPQAAAEWHCPQCHRFFCPACLHQIRRVGGQALLLCPMCSARCQPLSAVPAEQPAKSSFLGFLRRLFGGTRRPRAE